MIGHAFGSIPICPGGTDGFVFTDFGCLTTLFKILPVGDIVQAVNDASPFVKPISAPLLGTATPTVLEKLVPNTLCAVLLLQKTPKSRLFPTAPAPAFKTI